MLVLLLTYAILSKKERREKQNAQAFDDLGKLLFAREKLLLLFGEPLVVDLVVRAVFLDDLQAVVKLL